MPERTISSVGELREIAQLLLSYAEEERIFIFYGDLGAGKTTLIKELCRCLGVKDSASSPTFSIVNEYPGSRDLVYHFDFYRIRSEEEAYDLGYEEYFYSGKYCFVEWPRCILSLLPDVFIRIELQIVSESERYLKYNRIQR